MKMLNLITILLLIFSASCESNSGHSGISQDIKDSKRRGVFLSEYTVYPNPYKINDSLQITVKEAWVEKQWAYGKHSDETILYPNEDYQLCINTMENDIEGMITLDWTIGINGNKYMRLCSKNSLVGDFKTIPLDTIEYKVQKGDNLGDIGKKTIIGKFVLIKKKQ